MHFLLHVFARQEYILPPFWKGNIIYNSENIQIIGDLNAHTGDIQATSTSILANKKWHKAEICITYVIWSIPLKTSGQ